VAAKKKSSDGVCRSNEKKGQNMDTLRAAQQKFSLERKGKRR
jgi:hypothetical protein